MVVLPIVFPVIVLFPPEVEIPKHEVEIEAVEPAIANQPIVLFVIATCVANGVTINSYITTCTRCVYT